MVGLLIETVATLAGLAVRTGLTQADFLARRARRRARAPTRLVVYQAMPGRLRQLLQAA